MPITKWNPKFVRVYSRHPSHNYLRNLNGLEVEVPTLVRLGSTTHWKGAQIEINTIESIDNCSDKITMKNIFAEAEIKSPTHYTHKEMELMVAEGDKIKFPIIAKLQYRSKGIGMRKLDNIGALKAFLNGNEYKSSLRRGKVYYFEVFKNYNKEYRIHVSSLGHCFYTCRKMIKQDTPDNRKWFKNDENSNWILEDNPLFDKPDNWDEIVSECNRARDILGLDIAACDVRVAADGRFVIIEANSAPSFGGITRFRYAEIVYRLYNKKLSELKNQ